MISQKLMKCSPYCKDFLWSSCDFLYHRDVLYWIAMLSCAPMTFEIMSLPTEIGMSAVLWTSVRFCDSETLRDSVTSKQHTSHLWPSYNIGNVHSENKDILFNFKTFIMRGKMHNVSFIIYSNFNLQPITVFKSRFIVKLRDFVREDR